MRFPIGILIVSLVAFLTGVLPAPAQAPAPEVLQFEEVSVTADSRGPAIWRVTRGNAEVWILPTVGLMPEDLAWNKASLQKIITSAKQVMLPPQPDLNLIDIGWFYLWNSSLIRQPRGQTLEGSLPEPLRTRFAAARALAERETDRYASDIPAVAAIRLGRDFARALDLTRREPRRTVERLAREAKVKIANVGSFEVMPAVRELLNLSHDKQRICLEQVVADTERVARDAERAANEWADGRILAAQPHYSETRIIDCATSLSSSAAKVEVAHNTMLANAIDVALRTPGKSVALIPLGPLTRKGGVLDLLGNKGVVIHQPET